MEKTDKLSVFISLVLRHKPEAANIQLDEHGWAEVDALIEGIRNTGRKIDFDILKEIVPVDVELAEAEPPEFLYHGTAERFLESIKKEGLRPMSRLYVHLSRDEATALKVGKRHGKPVVLKVNAGKMQQDGFRFFLSENGVWLTDKVPVSYLSF